MRVPDRAMRAGINCALANRQILTHLTRQAFADLFPQAWIGLLYDVSHNTCKARSTRSKAANGACSSTARAQPAPSDHVLIPQDRMLVEVYTPVDSQNCRRLRQPDDLP